MSPWLQSFQQVARHDAAHGARPTHAHAAEELAVGDEDEAVRAAGEAAVEAALDDGHAAWRQRLAHATDRRGQDVRLGEDLGQARRLVRGEHDAGALRAPATHRVRQASRSAPAAGPARASRRGCRRVGLPRRRAPRSAAACGPRPGHASSPAAPGRLGAQRGGQLAGALQLLAALRVLLVERLGDVVDIVRLVEQPDGLAEVVETPWPARGSRPRAPRRRPARRPRSAPGRPPGSRELAAPRDRGAASQLRAGPRAQEELAGRQQGGLLDGRRAPLVGGVEGTQGRRSRRRTTRRAPARAGRRGRHRGCRRAARTRRDRRPPAPSRSRVARARSRRGPWARRSPRRSVTGRAGMSAGAMVRWKSACRLATRMAAGRSVRCQAARAATRAADSSRTSSERS